MLLTEINVEDLDLLMQFRIERFLCFFTSSLPHCLLQIDADRLLTIYCPHSEVVDDLLEDLDDLCSHARLILGMNRISLCLGLEEILCIDV
jgi:hypothetical protein